MIAVILLLATATALTLAPVFERGLDRLIYELTK